MEEIKKAGVPIDTAGLQPPRRVRASESQAEGDRDRREVKVGELVSIRQK
jgi:hypothetical protein